MENEKYMNMEKKHTLLEMLLRYKQVLYIFTVVAVLVGVAALFMMPRDEYPEFTVPMGLIVGVFPGASSQQVEEQLTTKVENYLFQYKSVDRSKTYSVSKENVMLIYVQVSEAERDKDRFWAKLRLGLTDLKAELPAGVTSLTADNDFGSTSALLLAVQSETKTYKELEHYITLFEEDVRKVPSVSKVKHYGLQKEQISVYMDDAKLANYGIKPIQVLAALKPQSAVNYVGELDDGKYVHPIHISSNLKAEQDVASQIVYSDPQGNVVRIKDIAKVIREYVDMDSYIRVNGKKCLLVSLEMKSGENVVRFGDEVQKAIDKISVLLPPDIKIITISDIPNVVSKSIANFLKEFAIAMIAVLLVTILLLPIRIARIAAMSIPASILTAIGIMWASGMELQTVSLAGLIIVLGITVDDAIVIVDNYIEKLDHGMAPFDAGTKSVTQLFSSVLSATLIIIVCFLPMPIFMSGTAGDFIKSLPITIVSALLISLLISVSIIPLLSYTFIKTGVKDNSSTKEKPTFLDRLQLFYNGALEEAFKRKKLVVFAGCFSFIIGLVLLAITPQQSFPKIERNQFAVEVFLPTGSSLRKTDSVMTDLERILQKDSRVRDVASFVGTSSPRFNALYAPHFPAKNYGQLIVVTESNKATVEILDEYSKKLEGKYPLANIKWVQLAFETFKAPIEIRISGDSIQTIKQTANRVFDIVRQFKDIEFVRTDYEQPLQSADLVVKKDEATRLGYSNSLLAYSLMVGTRGFPITTVWEGDYPVDVILKIDKKTKSRPSDIMNQYVTSPFMFSSVPVRQLATIKPGWTEGGIVRRNGVRTITVLAEIKRGLLAAPIFNKIKPLVDNMDMPSGISIEYGGDHQMSDENITPMYNSLIVSIILIFLILMFQFKNIKTTLLIMVTLPLSVFGAAIGIFLTGYPFGTTAFIGLIGLFGIVVRNGVIFVSYAEELRHEHGHTLEEAAISAGKRRMRPIFLTSAAAAVGVIPMIASGSSLWGPLGTVVCFGLLFALVLSLLVLPVLYYLFHIKDFEESEAM
ncbi:MAG TPA: efflux RND transporter permease subunit [Bacteroidota bacterium]|nr:efflux RND transporter permease subunit [Bacteroidota bacterium]